VVIERVKALVADQFDIDEDEITSDMTFEEIGADLLDVAELLEALAEEFECEIPEDCTDGIVTIGDAARCVKKYLRK